MNLDRAFPCPAPERAALELADLPTHLIPLAADDAGAPRRSAAPGRLREALRAVLHELPELHHAAPHLGEGCCRPG